MMYDLKDSFDDSMYDYGEDSYLDDFDDEDYDDFNDPVDDDYLAYLAEQADREYKRMQEQMSMEVCKDD